MSYSGEGRSSQIMPPKNVNTTHILRDARKDNMVACVSLEGLAKDDCICAARGFVSRPWGVVLLCPGLNERNAFHLKLKT